MTAPLEYTGRLHPRLAVLRHDKFRLLFIATLGSGLGTWIATIALTLDVQQRSRFDLVGCSAPDRVVPADDA